MSLFQGMVTPVPTPFGSDGRPAPELVAALAEFHARAGVRGFFAVGTWGAFPLLSPEERKAVGAAWCREGKRLGLPVLIQVGSPSLEHAKDLVRHAVDCGADAVASIPPYYYSGAGFYGSDDFRRFFSELIRTARGTPVYLYNNPRTTGILLTPLQFLELCRLGVAGVKDGSKSLEWLTEALDLLQDARISECEIMPGNTSGLLMGLAYGVRAVISGSAATSPSLACRIFDAWSEGRLAEAASNHRRLLAIRRLIEEKGKPPVLAYGLLRRRGVEIGDPRPPWAAPTDETMDRLFHKILEIEEIGAPDDSCSVP